MAHGIPAFARKHAVPCQRCHAPVYPRLNEVGRAFKENGLRFVGKTRVTGGEPTPTWTTGDKLRLNDLGFSVRARSSVIVPVDTEATGLNSVDFRMFDNLWLIAGGTIHRHVSLFASAALPPRPFLHQAYVGVHNVFDRGLLNLRAGQLLLFDFLRPEHREITGIGNPAATVQMGLNPTLLDTSHLGFDAYGRAFGRRLFYRAAVVQGAQGEDGLSDLDNHKDFFGQLEFRLYKRNRIGALGYLGRTQIIDDTQGVVVRFTDEFWIAGGYAAAEIGPLELSGYALHSRHSNAFGNGFAASYTSYRAQALAAITRQLVAVVRFDSVASAEDPRLDSEVLTTHLTFLYLQNLKLSVEYAVVFDDFDLSTTLVRLDVAL